MPSYKLYTPEASFRAFSILIAAEYNGITIDVSTDDLANIASIKSPVGKLPVLELGSDGTCIFSSHAAARYVGSLRRDCGLMGSTMQETAAIDAWMDWSAQDLELPACVWFYPVAGYMPFNQSAYEKAKTDLGNALKVLNDYLQYKTYLVTDQITLADIVVASTLVYPFKLVADKDFVKPYPNVIRWFTTCVNQGEFQQVIGQVTMCKKELMAPGQTAAAGGAGKAAKSKDVAVDGAAGGKKKKEKKEKEVDDAEDEPVVVEKKADHPYKIMDKEFPSAFSMDAWKKTYSNCSSYDDAMNTFWETFDTEGWSLWYQTYKFNEENKRTFMTSNAVTGFQQRTDEIRKWSFGVMDVLGTEETSLEIAGVWLMRGHTVEHMINANDDANWYDWKPLSEKGQPVSDENKAFVKMYWTESEKIEDKIIQDSKVFK